MLSSLRVVGRQDPLLDVCVRAPNMDRVTGQDDSSKPTNNATHPNNPNMPTSESGTATLSGRSSANKWYQTRHNPS